MKKRILAGCLAAASALSLTCGLTGCSDSAKVNITDDGDALTILAWSGNSDIRNMVNLFCAEKGYTVDKDVKVVDCGDSGGKAREQYAQYLIGTEDADLMCLEADWILEYINDDTRTADLSEIGITESSFASPYSYTVAIGKNKEGKLRGASFQATPGGFVYRADLAKQHLGVNSPEEMQAKISNWEGFEATAKELHDKAGIALTSTEGGLWQVYQANRTKPWVQNNTLVMDNAEDFYDIAKRYADSGYMTKASQWSNEWYATVTNGDALGVFLSTWGMTDSDGGQLKNFATKEKTDSNAVMAFCNGPQQYFWGGTWLGVTTKCDNKTLAKEFIEFFTCNNETMKKYALATGDYCNNSTVMGEIVAEGTHSNKYLVNGQSQFPNFLEQAKKINMDGLITEYDSFIKEQFNDSVMGYINGTYATKEDAIKAFKSKVAAQYQDMKVN